MDFVKLPSTMILNKKEEKEGIVEQMFQVGAHFGYDKSRRHPSVSKFIFGRKDNFEIFDLEKTAEKLSVALEFVKKTAGEGRQILFVGGKKEAQNAIKNGAEKIDMPYVASRWIGGTLTNFEEIRKRVNYYLDLHSQKEKGLLAKYTKKERLMIDRDLEKLESRFGGITNMEVKPAVIFIIDTNREYIARDEAMQNHIPIIGLVGSDNNISGIDYPIPANDSSIKSIKFFVDQIVSAYELGLKEKKV
jgi:small subunit ribosomal protein S2